MLSCGAARQKVIEIAQASRGDDATWLSEVSDLSQALGRVLAGDINADRDYPPFDRSTRDGFALRSKDVKRIPQSLCRVGESKAGSAYEGEVACNQCVQIMTGAPVPRGADAVVMLEHVRVRPSEVLVERRVQAGQNIVAAGSEAKRGQAVLMRGTRLGYAELAMAAQVGYARVGVYRRPRIAILSTGDEVVAVDDQPGPFEIRNSNTVSLAAQVVLVGAEPVPLPNAPDRVPELIELIKQGLDADILVLSGGVSMGEYDLVEGVLRELGAEFFFDSVAIRPGRPAVFGKCRDRLVFGLPGNPVSTMVTFELLVVPAVDIVGGTAPRSLSTFKAKLGRPVEQKAILTHFLPARVTWTECEPMVEELPWKGSGDIVALAHANCFLVVPETKLKMEAGDWVDVLPRRDVI